MVCQMHLQNLLNNIHSNHHCLLLITGPTLNFVTKTPFCFYIVNIQYFLGRYPTKAIQKKKKKKTQSPHSTLSFILCYNADRLVAHERIVVKKATCSMNTALIYACPATATPSNRDVKQLLMCLLSRNKNISTLTLEIKVYTRSI